MGLLFLRFGVRGATLASRTLSQLRVESHRDVNALKVEEEKGMRALNSPPDET